MDFFLTGILTVFIFGILVFVHELGHFLAAVKAGVYVEEFAFGFGPKIFSKKWKDVEYRINLIPLGGYVKMLGDMDGSSFMRHSTEDLDKKSIKFVKDTLKKHGLGSRDASFAEVKSFIEENKEDFTEEQILAFEDYLAYDFIPNHPANFDNKSFSQRLVILIAGVTLNFVLGAILFYVLFIFTNFTVDLSRIGNPRFIGAKTSSPPVLFHIYNEEFKDYSGSLIHRINGETIISPEQFDLIMDENYNQPVSITVENSSGMTEVNMVLIGEGINTNFDEEVRDRVLLLDVAEGSAAQTAGIQSGDIVVSMNGLDVNDPDDLRLMLDELRGEKVMVTIIDSSAKLLELEVDLPDPEEGEPILGAIPVTNSPFFDSIIRVNYQHNKASSGVLHGTNVLTYNATALAGFIRQAFEEKSPEPVFSQVSSIVAVVDVTFSLVRANNFLSLLNLVAMLNIILAFMNILPIPLFDGGHVMFLFIEKIRGRKISTETQNKVGKSVFILLIVLTVAIMLKDVLMFDWPERIANTVRGLVN